MTDKRIRSASLMLTICLMLAYLLPYHQYPFMAFYNDWLAFLGLVLLIAFLCTENPTALRIPWISILPLGLVAVILIQLALGKLTFEWDTSLPIAYLILTFFAIIAGTTYQALSGKNVDFFVSIAWAHLLAGLASSIIATLQFTGLESWFVPYVMPVPHDKSIRPYANLGQPNQFALLLCLAIASVWMLYQTYKLHAKGAIGSILVLLWGLALAQSRLGWVIIPLFVLFNVVWKTNSMLKPVSSILVLGIFLGFICISINLPNLDFGTGLESRLISSENRAGSINERWVYIQQAWQTSLNYPWLGAGWLQFGTQQIQIGNQFSPAPYSEHSHNIVLNFAAEIGWPITILFFSCLGYWFFRTCLIPTLNRQIMPATGYATLFLCAILIHSLVEYPLWYGYVLIPTALMIGAIHPVKWGSHTLFLPAYGLVSIFILTAASMLLVAKDYRQLVTGFRALQWENLGMKADEGSSKKPERTLFPHYYDYFKFAKTQARENTSAEEIVAMERITKRFGYAPVLMRMSLAYALNGRPDAALKTVKILKSLHSVHYHEMYENWKAMAEHHPARYAEVFKKIPLPEPKKISKQ